MLRSFSSPSVFRVAFCLAALFFARNFGLGMDEPVQPGDDAPKILPRVEVTAVVPLVKVADYRMREARFAPAAVADGDFIYIIGGSNSGNVTLDSIERFNVRTGVSENFAKLNIGRLAHGAIVAGGKIYVLGGKSVQLRPAGSPRGGEFDIARPYLNNPDARPYFEPTVEDRFRAIREQELHGIDAADPVQNLSGLELESSMEVVDLATRRVTRGAGLPEARAAFACVEFGGKIYAIGGQVERGSTLAHSGAMAVFDLATGKWSRGAPMPTPRDSAAAWVDGGFIIVPGGYNGRVALDVVDVFNPRQGTWRNLPPLCHPVSAHSLAFLGHYLFLFGNYDSPEELIAYDLFSKESASFTLDYKSARHTAAVVHEGKIYVMGGKVYRSSEALDYIQVFTLRKKDDVRRP